jgi:hypothetical protein
MSMQTIHSDDRETDRLRLNELASKHGLSFRKVGRTYIFDDFTAHGLKQALGFAEDFDRAKLRPDDS